MIFVIQVKNHAGKKDIMTSRLKLLGDRGAVGFFYMRTRNRCAYLMSSILYYVLHIL